MKDEIKEILDKLRSDDYYEKEYQKSVYYERDLKKLEDYITNLQKKYEEADNDRHKLFEQKEKAIDYITSEEYFDLNNRKTGLFVEDSNNYMKAHDKLLNILQGEDKE